MYPHPQPNALTASMGKKNPSVSGTGVKTGALVSAPSLVQTKGIYR